MTDSPRRTALALGAALIGAAALPRAVAAQGAAPSAAPRLPETLPGAPGLYRRIIVRPGSALSPQPGAAGRPVQGFSVFYVYDRREQPDGTWLEVGSALDGRVSGWLPEARGIPWRHNLVLAFNNPAARERAMFFRDAAMSSPRASLTGSGRRSTCPMAWSLTPLSRISRRSLTMNRASSPMSAATSSAGRFQFSVEKL